MAKRTSVRARSTPLSFIARSRQTSSEEKAMFHNVTGAGKSGVIREFFNLHETDQEALRDDLERLIATRLPK